MGAALSVFVLLSVSVFVIRVSSVALRLTGLAEQTARFQSLSAFTGTGFTTTEAEAIVNYPIRRRIIALLMIVGNMGLVTVFATLVVGLIQTEGEVAAVIVQLAWLSGGLALLWFMMLNRTADRIMCSLIGKFLESTTFLGQRRYQRLLQVGNGFSVCEHPISNPQLHQQVSAKYGFCDQRFTPLAVRFADGTMSTEIPTGRLLDPGDSLILFGRDEDHDQQVQSITQTSALSD
jgi:hypothetical protein